MKKEVYETWPFSEVIINFQELMDLNDLGCAYLFDVGSKSVGRWRKEITTPRQIVRNHVYKIVRKELERG